MEPLIIEDKFTKSLLARYFLRLVFRLGEFSVDPFTGQLLFKLSFNQDFYNTENSKFNYDIFFKLVRLAFSTTYYAIDIHLLRILVLSNIITQKQYDQFKKISNYINDKSILYFREISHEASELMKNIIRYLGYMKNNRSLIYNVTEELKKLKEMTQIPKGSNQGEGISTLKQWDDFKLQKQDEIGEGGFAKIYRVQGTPIIKDDNKQNTNQTSYFALKIDKDPSKLNEHSRIKREIEFLSQIKNSCPFINKYYYIKGDQEYKLYMELVQTSLDRYCSYNKSLITLHTRLFFMVQLALSLKFMKDNNIYHLDLKPSNILLGNNLFIRVTDFGESQSLNSIEKAQKEQQSISPAYTLPFASPERFTDEKGYSIDHQSDIFSFGAIISEIIFQKNLLDCKKWNHKIIVKKLQKLQYKILLSNFNLDQAGSKHVLQIIKLIMLLCVHPDKKKRPQIEWIIIIFKQLISYLEQLY